MSASLWELPENLQSAVEAGALSMQEASAMEDCNLLDPELAEVPLPRSLWTAAQRLYLHESEMPEGPLQ
jgi:hypothetical protein